MNGLITESVEIGSLIFYVVGRNYERSPEKIILKYLTRVLVSNVTGLPLCQILKRRLGKIAKIGQHAGFELATAGILSETSEIGTIRMGVDTNLSISSV